MLVVLLRGGACDAPGRNLGLTALAAVLLGLLYLYLDGGAPGASFRRRQLNQPSGCSMSGTQRFRNMTVTLASGRATVYAPTWCFRTGNFWAYKTPWDSPWWWSISLALPWTLPSYQMMLLAAQHIPVTAKYDALDLEACGLASPAARLGDCLC